MPNISDQELRNMLFPEKTLEFLESHPGCYQRAAKMYGKAAITYQGKATNYVLDKAFEKLSRAREVVQTNPDLFAK
jgi:hypothetical protein